MNVKSSFPRSVQERSGGHFLLNVDRTSTEPFSGTKRILFDAPTVDHPNVRLGSKLPDTVQTMIIERRKNGLIQTVVVTESKQDLDLDPWLGAIELFDVQT